MVPPEYGRKRGPPGNQKDIYGKEMQDGKGKKQSAAIHEKKIERRIETNNCRELPRASQICLL